MPETFIPAHEEIKRASVEFIKQINELAEELDRYKMYKKRNAKLERELRAKVRSFFRFLRPYMKKYSESGKGFVKEFEILDSFNKKPSKFGLGEAMEAIDYLFMFANEYGITSIEPQKAKVG